MSKIDAMKVRINEIYKEINILNKEDATPENLEKVRKLERQIAELRVAIQHRRNQIGLRNVG